MAPGVQTVQDEDELLTGEAVALDVRPANFILRAAGALIDVACSLILFVAAMIGLSTLASYLPIDDALATAVTLVALVVCIVIVPTLVETLWRGRSLGKLVIGARIVRDDGGSAGFRHAFIRALAGVLEIYATAGGIAIVVGLVNSRAKRLGDLLAGTYSQHERVPAIPPAAPPMPTVLYSWSAVADVARMPDRLARRIAQFLLNAPAMTPESRQRLATELAIEADAYVSPRPMVDPETYLVGISAKRRDREYTALSAAQNRLARLAPIHRLPHGFPDR